MMYPTPSVYRQAPLNSLNDKQQLGTWIGFCPFGSAGHFKLLMIYLVYFMCMKNTILMASPLNQTKYLIKGKGNTNIPNIISFTKQGFLSNSIVLLFLEHYKQSKSTTSCEPFCQLPNYFPGEPLLCLPSISSHPVIEHQGWKGTGKSCDLMQCQFFFFF